MGWTRHLVSGVDAIRDGERDEEQAEGYLYEVAAVVCRGVGAHISPLGEEQGSRGDGKDSNGPARGED